MKTRIYATPPAVKGLINKYALRDRGRRGALVWRLTVTPVMDDCVPGSNLADPPCVFQTNIFVSPFSMWLGGHANGGFVELKLKAYAGWTRYQVGLLSCSTACRLSSVSVKKCLSESHGIPCLYLSRAHTGSVLGVIRSQNSSINTKRTGKVRVSVGKWEGVGRECG